MSGRVRPEDVLRFLGVQDDELLHELRREGLFTDAELAPDQAEELRVAASLVRELGVNAAGVEVALQLRRRLLVLENRFVETLEILWEERGGR